MSWSSKVWWQRAGAACMGALMMFAGVRGSTDSVALAAVAGSLWLAVVAWAAHQRPGRGVVVAVADGRLNVSEAGGHVRSVPLEEVRGITLQHRRTFRYDEHFVLVITEKGSEANWTIPDDATGVAPLRDWIELQPWFDPDRWDSAVFAASAARNTRLLWTSCAAVALQAAALVLRVTDSWLYFGVANLVFFAGFYWWAKRPSRESRYIVTMIEDHIDLLDPEGGTASLIRNDVREIVVETRANGDDDPDIWWVLSGTDPTQRLCIPMMATGMDELTKWADTLPGIDLAAHSAAMDAEGDGRFVIWKRSNAT